MSEPSDEELVQRSLAGEARAFAQLVEKHQRLVFAVALSGACDVGQAEDVAQEAFVEAWRNLPRLRDRARVGSSIAGIARNLGRRWTRHTARRRKRETTAMNAPRDAAPTPLDSALGAEMQSLLRAALATIPAAYREALVLYYVHGRWLPRSRPDSASAKISSSSGCRAAAARCAHRWRRDSMERSSNSVQARPSPRR